MQEKTFTQEDIFFYFYRKVFVSAKTIFFSLDALLGECEFFETM